MLTSTNTPDALSLSRNPVEFRLQATDGSGNPYGPQGASAEVTTNVNGLQVGDTLTLNWTEADGSTGSITFTAKASPVATVETDVQAQPSGLSNLVYFQTVARKIGSHSVVSALFSLTTDSPTAGAYRITFTALDTSSDFSVSLDISGIGAFSSPTTSNTAAVADNTPDNYSILLDVFFESEYESDNFEKVAELEAKPDADGYLEFKIQSVLHAQGKLSFTETSLPDPGGTVAPLLADNIRRYYVRYREDYEGVFLAGDGDWTYSSMLKVMLGGISQKLWAEVDFFDNIDNTSSWLTWYPERKTVSVNQPEWLPWFNYLSADKEIVLQVIRYTASSTLTTLYKYNTADAVPEAEVLLIPVGVDQLESAGVTMEDVVKYTVRVVDDTSDWEGGNPTFLSPARTFYVDRSRYEEQRYVVYLNSFFCPLTLRCVGLLTEDLEVEAQESTRILPRNYTAEMAEKFTHETEWERPHIYRSGYIGKLEAKALQEMLVYRMAWEIEAGDYNALFITGKKFNITETRQHLHSVSFTAVKALRSVSYSDDTNITEESGVFWELEADTDLYELEGSTDLWKLETT